jgi:hypothetical protein
MKIEGRRRLGVIAATVAAVLIGGGVAVAFWTTTGTGAGSAGVGTSTSVSIAQADPITDLFPGGPAAEINFTITNTNAGPVRISTVTVAVSGVVKAPGAAAGTCDATDFIIDQPSAINADIPVGPTTFTSATTNASIAMVNKPTNQDACKNATVALSYTTP